jgi:hypothetical protein
VANKKRVLYGDAAIAAHDAFVAKLPRRLRADFEAMMDTVCSWYTVVLLNNIQLRDGLKKKVKGGKG